MFVPYLAYGCGSIDFNIERVRGYVNNACSVCGTTSAFKPSGKFECDCPPLMWDAYDINPDVSTQSIPLVYTTPGGIGTGSGYATAAPSNRTVNAVTYLGGSLVRYTTTATHGFKVGYVVSITQATGVFPAWLQATYFVITAVTSNTFTGYIPCKDCTVTDPGYTTSPGSISLSGATATVAFHNESPAPWYDPDVPASARFLGYVIEDLTGLDGTVKRELTPKLTGYGGGTFGPYQVGPRQLQVTVLLFACDEEAMAYGFRYLKDALGYWACSNCEVCTATVATACQSLSTFNSLGLYQPPTPTDVLKERWDLYNVSLLEGPVLTDDPMPRVGCNLRRARFVLGAENPWLHSCETDLFADKYVSPTGDVSKEGDVLCNNSATPMTITNVQANTPIAGLLTFTCANTTNYRPGDVVTITDVLPLNYNLVDAVVLYSIDQVVSGGVVTTPATFVVASSQTGAYTSGGVATLVERSYEYVSAIQPTINVGDIAINVSITNSSPTTDSGQVVIGLYPDNLGYKYWNWRSFECATCSGTGLTDYATSSAAASGSSPIAYGEKYTFTINYTIPIQPLKYQIGQEIMVVAGENRWIKGVVVSYSTVPNALTISTTGWYGITDPTAITSWSFSYPTPLSWTQPDPCARVVISSIPAGYTFTIDSTNELYTLKSLGGDVIDGTPWVRVEPGNAPEFLSARCNRYALSISGNELDIACGMTMSASIQHREL